MKIQSLNSLITFISLVLCLVFVTQLSMDIVVKYKVSEKKESLADGEDENEEEREKEKEREKEVKIFNAQAYQLVYQKKINMVVKREKTTNVSSIFSKVFTPPPEM